MSRMRLTITRTGGVLLAYTDWMGDRREREFFVGVSDGSGYVREYDDRGDCPQVCERLANMGSTLMCSREALPAVIRREYRRMRAAERAEVAS